MNYLKSKFIVLIPCLFFFNYQLFAQEDDFDLLSELNLEEEAPVFKSLASFKSTRVVNSHSLETTHKNVLDFRISHRFGLISSGINDLFGLDQATMRMGFDYGILDNLTVGIGRSTYQKTLDGFIKYKPIWQTEGSNKVPISVLAVAGLTVNTQKFAAISYDMTFPRRLNSFSQLIIGRKFNDKFSLQIMPTHVHRNLVETRAEGNSIFALGSAARYKFVKRVSVNLESYYVFPNQLGLTQQPYSFSLGFDVETGGHVFQLFFSNSIGFIEKAFIGENTADFFRGDIHFGFTISRVFDFKKNPDKKKRNNNKG